MKTFKWQITAKKAATVAIYVIISGSIAYLDSNGVWLGLIPILTAVENVVKHWND